MNQKSFLYENLDPESERIVKETFANKYRKAAIKCEGFLFSKSIENFADKIRNMQIRDDDIWVCTFPKAGTTWVSEMVWCIKSGLNHNDVQNYIYRRVPFLEISAVFDSLEVMNGTEDSVVFSNFLDVMDGAEDSVERVIKLPSPRVIKTHLPFNLLPEKLQNFSTNAKIIHVSRNPRDTMISYYHHCRLIEDYKGTIQQFAELFLNGMVMYGPFPAHLKGYLAHGKNSKIMFLKYEDLKKDLKLAIEKTCNYLGKSISDSEKEKLLDHLSFSSMKQNPAINFPRGMKNKKLKQNDDDGGNFMRRGIVGDWKDKLDVELCRRFEEWEKSNLREIDFTLSI